MEALGKATSQGPALEEAHAFLMRLYALSGRPERRRPARSKAIAVTQMGGLRRCTYREGVLVLVAEDDLLPADATGMPFSIPALFRLAVAVMPGLDPGFADVECLTGVLWFTYAPAAIARVTDSVRAGGWRLLARNGRGGLLGLPNRGFGNYRALGGILAVFCLGGRAW